MRKGERKLFDEGYRFHSYEYDWDAQREVRRLEDKGYEVALLREKTDTQGLKMFSVWLKPIEGGDEKYVNASINAKGNKMKKTAFATFDDAKEMMYEIMDAARNFQPWPMRPEGDFHESELSGVWLLDFWIEGDWKHDHWAFDSQVQELYPFLLYKGESVTESDGSDDYTAVHQFAFAGKDIDLNAMARLFASKQSKKAMKKRAYLDGYDITIYRVEVTPIDSENLIAEYGEYENLENAIDKADFVASNYINEDEERVVVVEYTFHADDMEWECGGDVYECEF